MEFSVEHHRAPIAIRASTSQAVSLPSHGIFLAEGSSQVFIAPIEWKVDEATPPAVVKTDEKAAEAVASSTEAYGWSEEVDEAALEFFSE
ncbi:unnamed protein product [Phytomonas sp. EM1]|nr:unnamed protein product [Phytomonas sp. EM1]|eukprot:CCW65536.1 unnamed protein product [Phytomonas sp. isolate EM1]